MRLPGGLVEIGETLMAAYSYKDVVYRDDFIAAQARWEKDAEIDRLTKALKVETSHAP